MNFGISLNPLDAVAGLANAGATVFNTLSSNKWARKNYNLQKLSQEESMFMNRNQFQVQSSDALKAGINPLAMNGGSVSSASAQNVEAPQMDLSGVNHILGQILQAKNEKDLQKQFQEWKSEEDAKQRKHDEELALMRIQSEERRHSDSLIQEDKHFNANLDEIKSYHDEMFKIQNSQLSLKEKEFELDKLRYDIELSTADSLNSLRQQQQYLNEVDLQTRARELANLITTGEKQHNSSSLVSMAKNLGIAISGNAKDVNEWTKAIIQYVKKGKKNE